MSIRTERLSIPHTVLKSVLNDYEGPYFYHQGMAMEDTVRDTLTQECVQAVFEGFEVMSIVEQQAFLSEPPQEETVTAKLFYTVWINTKS